MTRALITLLLLGVALLIAGVGVAGAAFMFSHPGPGPAVIGVIFGATLILFAIFVAFGALTVSFTPSKPSPTDPAHLDDDARTHKKEPCIMCGYDLTNLPRRGRCPECGFSYDLDDRDETFTESPGQHGD